jgi:hypothetical protein
MRIPPLYRKPSWQQLLSGMMIGAVISWFVFLYIYGILQEKQAKLIHAQKDTIEELQGDIKIWQEEYKMLNKKNIELLTVQKINVKIINGDKYKIDPFSVSEAEDSVKKDINMMIAKDLESVFKNRELLKKVIENEEVRINGKRYRIEVKEMLIYTTLSIHLSITLA